MFLKRFLSISAIERDILKKKLKYIATKRGILENEIIFDKFITNHFNKLNETDIILFKDFFQEYDWDILAWLTGQRTAPEKYFNSDLLKLLKDCIIKK